MKKRTVKLTIETTLPTDDRYCDNCPALGERYCKHLNVSLESQELVGKVDRILCHRHQDCPFNPPKCRLCNGVLNPTMLDKSYILEHNCSIAPNDTTIVIGAESFDECINQYNEYIYAVGKHFRQR